MMVICGHLGSLQRSLRGRRLKGKGKGVLDARETRGAREEGGRETSLPPLLERPSRFAFLPFPSLSNACHAGYLPRRRF